MVTPAKKTTPAPAKTTPAPAKKAPEPAKAPPPAAAKAAPAKAPEHKPEPQKAAPKPAVQEAPPEVKTEAKKKTAEETLAATARDRGWLTSPRPGDFDVVYMKSNPVLGGYENLRLKFTKSGGLFEIEHENLNKKIPVPEDDQLDYAVHVLTGE